MNLERLIAFMIYAFSLIHEINEKFILFCSLSTNT